MLVCREAVHGLPRMWLEVDKTHPVENWIVAELLILIEK
jgi:hypothetical protein